MKVTVQYLKKFGVKHTETKETYYFVSKIDADPLYIDLVFDHGESVRVRQAHLIHLEIEEDPKVLIL